MFSCFTDDKDMDHQPGPAVAALMKLSFDEEHRHAICSLGEWSTGSGGGSQRVQFTINIILQWAL